MPPPDALSEIANAGDHLRAEAAPAPAPAPGGDQAAAPAAPPPKDQATVDREEIEQWAGFPFLFGSVVSEALPELAPVYTEARCVTWGEKMLPVARKHGWKPGVVGMYGALAGATLGFLKPTAQAVVARRRAALDAARQAQAQAPTHHGPARVAAPGPATDTVTGPGGASSPATP